MTISGFQSYAFSAVRLSMTVTSAASAPAALPSASAPAPDAPVDRVSLSPEATTSAASTDDTDAVATEPSELPAAAPAPSVPPPSRAARRADALFTALDGDQDGAISEDEFKDGALNLLRNAGARRRVDDDGDRDGRSLRGLGRVERKLEKIFDRVDKNDDGAIDQDELTAAVSRGRGRRGGPDGAPPADASAPDGQAAGAAGISISISVTYVSLAMQRYTSVQGGEPAPPPLAAPAPEPDAETPALAA